MRHAVVMVATSYPRFPGDGVGSFMEPIAKSVAARGHAVHLVAPWHPLVTRRGTDEGVTFHFFRYAPIPALNVFGYATGLRADTHVRAAAWAVAPLALVAGWRQARAVAASVRATVLHGHWVVPGGLIAAHAAGRRPLVVTLHGSDVFVAERHALARRSARYVFRRAACVTAASDDLRDRAIALGAAAARTETLPYGVDIARFAPSASVRAAIRRELGLGDRPVVLAAGRLVRKKGFEHLIAAAAELAPDFPALSVLIAGDGDLREELAARAAAVPSVRLLGNRSQEDIGRLAASADVIAVPSVHDAEGNVDGLPNFALEAMASATPVVASAVGGLAQAIEDGRTGRLVPEGQPAALAAAIGDLLGHAEVRRVLGEAARARVTRAYGWAHVAERLEQVYDRAVADANSHGL
jgi:phosphatidylinositol alpha-1,6-mannosyltransferase